MKKFISGLIIGILISMSIFTFANIEEITAYFAEFNIVINGQRVELENKPLVYEGKSYLPVREISNLLGYDVTYKADSRTIELDNHQAGQNTISKEVSNIRIDDTSIITIVSMSETEYLKIKDDYYTIREIDNLLIEVPYSFTYTPETYTIKFVKINYNNNLDKETYDILIEDIEYIVINNIVHITKAYFEDYILPIVKESK